MLNYDLHSHSTASDGSCKPSELVEIAIKNNVDVLALTDHDTVEGVDEALKTAIGTSVSLIPGVEVSVSWNETTIHILGLGVDPKSKQLNLGLSALREFRKSRAEEIGRLLELAGIPDTYQACVERVNGGLISRTHFAQVIIEKGFAKDIRKVFKKYLVKNKPGYVPGQWADLKEAIDWIKEAGGVAVIAHPARYKLSATKLRKLFEEFKSLGGGGLEVISGSHSDLECIRMADYCRQYDLSASMGSDFHGSFHPWRHLGKLRAMPEDLKTVWQLDSWPCEAIIKK